MKNNKIKLNFSEEFPTIFVKTYLTEFYSLVFSFIVLLNNSSKDSMIIVDCSSKNVKNVSEGEEQNAHILTIKFKSLMESPNADPPGTGLLDLDSDTENSQDQIIECFKNGINTYINLFSADVKDSTGTEVYKENENLLVKNFIFLIFFRSSIPSLWSLLR